MDKGAKKYGNIYEIPLPNGKFTYICRIKQYEFGIFDYFSEKPANTDELLSVGFKTYKSCIETAIRKKIWKRVIRNGNSSTVPQKDYIDLLKRGYIDGFFDDYKIFERWLSSNIEHYPDNQDIFPLPSLT